MDPRHFDVAMLKDNEDWGGFCYSFARKLLTNKQSKMVRMSVLADALKTLTNAEHKGKRQGIFSFNFIFPFFYFQHAC